MPHHGIGRGFKAGKEEIVGLLIALERFVKADDAADNEALAVRLGAMAALLEGIAGITVALVPAAQTGRVPVLEITVPDALAMSARLQSGDPPVHLSERHAARGVLTLDPQVLLPEHDRRWRRRSALRSMAGLESHCFAATMAAPAQRAFFGQYGDRKFNPGPQGLKVTLDVSRSIS